MILFARHRPQPTETLTIVQVPWSPAGPRSHTFEIAPSDIVRLSLDDWEARPTRLKTAAFGRRRDLRLVDDLTDRHQPHLGTVLGDGLILGKAENRTTADISDSAGAQTIVAAIRKRWPWLKHLFADGAYASWTLPPVTTSFWRVSAAPTSSPASESCPGDGWSSGLSAG